MRKTNNFYTLAFAFFLISPITSAQEVYDFSVEEDSQEENDSKDSYIVETEEVDIDGYFLKEEEIISPELVSVFNKEDIKESGAKTIADVVEKAPGVSINRQGGVLAPQLVSIRGSEYRHVLVLVDGVPINNLWGGAIDISNIPLSQVEKIEVIRGACSSHYGEGAVGGVINIITKMEEVSKLSAGIEYGFASFNTHQIHTKISAPFGEESLWSGWLNIGGLYTGGAYNYSSANKSRINNQAWNFNTSGGISFLENEGFPIDAFSLTGAFYMSEKGMPGLMEFLTPSAKSEILKANGSAKIDFSECPVGNFAILVNTSYNLNKYMDDEKQTNEKNSTIKVLSKIVWEKDNSIKNVFFNTSFVTGYSFNYLFSSALTNAYKTTIGGNAIEHSAYLSGLSNIMYKTLDFIPAFKMDVFVDNYASITIKPNFAFTWSTAIGWAPFRSDVKESPLYLKINGGTAYKNPSFQDLFWPQGALASGNSDLLPEKSISGDICLIYSLKEGKKLFAKIELSGYISRIENLIQWMPTAGGIWKPYNNDLALSRGLDSQLEISYQFLPDLLTLKIDGVYNWLLCQDANTSSVNYEKQLAYRPEHSANISAKLSYKDSIWFTFSTKYIGYRFTNNANTKYLNQVFILSTILGFNINESFTITGTANNLLNVYYSDSLGYPIPGFEFSITGGYKL